MSSIETAAQSVGDEAKCPTPKEIDRLIVEYASAQKTLMSAQVVAKVAGEAAGVLKTRLTAMVEAFGARSTECSRRLEGIRNSATTTTGRTLVTDGAAVEAFKTYLDASDMPDLVGQFFVAHTSYSMVAAPADVLAKLSLVERVRRKMASLLGLCNRVALKTPSLKVEVIEPVKP
jgi:hypothetical protein